MDKLDQNAMEVKEERFDDKIQDSERELIQLGKMEKSKSDSISEEQNTEEKKKQKIRFCKMCGGEIDIKTMQCLKCGKRYGFKRFIPKFKVWKVVFVISVVLNISLVFLVFYMYNKNLKMDSIEQELESAEKELSSVKIKYNNAQDRIEDKDNLINQLSERCAILSDKAVFLDNYIAFTYNDGNTVSAEYKYAGYNIKVDGSWGPW